MIVVGTFCAMVAGVGLPGHVLMFGEIVDNFISFDLANQLRDANNISSQMQAMAFLASGSMPTGPNQEEYFCNFTEDGDSNIFNYFLSDNLGDLLQSEVATFSYYYLILSFGLILVAFIANAFWNLSSLRQTRQMRSAFYRAILKQDIGWFDVNPSGELSTRLSEYVIV